MKTWNDIEGWFDYEELYSSMATKYNSGTFVEVGSWLGKSVCYLAKCCKDNNSNNIIYAIDNWDGLDKNYMEEAKIRHNHNSIFDIFKSNIEDCGLSDIISPIVSNSWDGAKFFDDNSCDFIFIDADHEYESVLKDIVAWYPKLKTNGVLAGHDIFADQVRRAVSDGLSQFGKNFSQSGTCWIMT